MNEPHAETLPDHQDVTSAPAMSEDATSAPLEDVHTAIEARSLGRRFGSQWAVAHLELDVMAGESVLLAGPNGSGKTTLVRLIAGLYRPTRGSLKIFGRDVRDERLTCRRQLSLVSHEGYLYPRLTALETLRVWSRLTGRPRRDEELEEMLFEVALEGARDKAVGGFSAGMKKRLTLLRTRLEEPRLVLLDEPFAALDVPGKRLVEDWVQDFRRAGVTVVVASHALEQASRLCDRAVILRRGQMIWRGGAEEVGAVFEKVT